jgi:Fur family ferric uptake transcriptional regulator
MSKPRVRGSIKGIIEELPEGVHLSAQEIYEKAQAQGLDLSLATVYRALNDLSQKGIINTVGGDVKKRYEGKAQNPDHDHLICVSCGFTVEFKDDLVSGFGDMLAKRKGYEFSSSRFDIFGLCAKCKTKRDTEMEQEAQTHLNKTLSSLKNAQDELEAALKETTKGKFVQCRDRVAKAKTDLRHALAEVEHCLGKLSI